MQRKKILHCLQRGLNSRPLVYKTSALPLSYRGFLCNSSPDRKEHIHWRDQSLLRWRHWNHETSPLNVFHLWCFTKNHWTSQLNFWVIIHAKVGLDRDLNPGPRAPEARIIPLDHQAKIKPRSPLNFVYNGYKRTFAVYHNDYKQMVSR